MTWTLVDMQDFGQLLFKWICWCQNEHRLYQRLQISTFKCKHVSGGVTAECITPV